MEIFINAIKKKYILAIRYFSPLKTYVETDQYKEIAALVLVCLTMTIFQAFYCLYIGLVIDSTIAFAMSACYLMGLFAFKYGIVKYKSLGRSLVIVSTLGVWGINMDAGMGVNPSMIWFPAIPIFAIIATGEKEGFIWTIISIILSYASMYLAKKYNYSFNEFNSEQWFEVGTSNLISAPLLFYCIFAFFYYKKNRDVNINSEFAKIGMNTSYLMHELGKPIFRLKNSNEYRRGDIEKIIEVYSIIHDVKLGESKTKNNISLSEIIKEQIKEFELFIEKYSIRIINNVDKIDILGNKASLEIIIKNLITNAIEASSGLQNPIILLRSEKNILEIENAFHAKNEYFDEHDYILNSSKKGNLGVGLLLTKQLCFINGIKIEINPIPTKKKFVVKLEFPEKS